MQSRQSISDLPETVELKYIATKTAQLFHADRNRVKGMLGPVGCGKSVSCCNHIMLSAINQAPGRDGIRRSRWAIVRSTYPELKSTTIKTWSAWFPEHIFGKIKYDSPISQMLKFNDVELEIFFLALDTPKDVRKLKSLELTGVYINEMQFCDELIFETCKQRTNRYPSKKDGAIPTYPGLIFDANPPSTLHWMYNIFEKEKPDNYSIYKYAPAVIKVDEAPPGVDFAISRNDSIFINNPDADYIQVQADPNYWLELVKGNTDEKIKVDLQGEFGVVVSGLPVHPTYNDRLHYANKALPYNPMVELCLGWDFGLTPACAIMQLTPLGQLFILDELWAVHMNLRDFSRDIVIPHLDINYPGWRFNYYSAHDPAGGSGAQTDGQSCEDILRAEGIKSVSAAENNNPTPRRDGLAVFLSRMTGGQPAFQLSNKCTMIREGLMGYFQYDRIQVGGEARYHKKPLKNMHSHICEGLEYGAMRYAPQIIKPLSTDKKKSKITNKNFMSR